MGERAETLAARAARAFANATAARRRRLDGLATLAGSLSYQSVLRRGFALVRDGEGGMARRRAGLAEGARLDIEFADGRIQATAGASPPTFTPPTGTENRRQPSEHAEARDERTAPAATAPSRTAARARCSERKIARPPSILTRRPETQMS